MRHEYRVLKNRRKERSAQKKSYTKVAAQTHQTTAPLMLRAQSRPWPTANCRSDGSVGVIASLAAVMSPMRQLHKGANVSGNKFER
jgi:hypothetical protein